MRRASLSIIVRGATSVKVWCGKWVRAEQGLVERFGAIPSAINPEEWSDLAPDASPSALAWYAGALGPLRTSTLVPVYTVSVFLF